jgi:hypothetical protein
MFATRMTNYFLISIEQIINSFEAHSLTMCDILYRGNEISSPG